MRVHGPWNEEISAFYGVIDNGETAVVEMAACAGLPLVEGRMYLSRTSTFGIGEFIFDAARNGAKKLS